MPFLRRIPNNQYQITNTKSDTQNSKGRNNIGHLAFCAKRRGFTMIELLVVVSIIGILTGVGTYSFNNAQAKARDARRKQDLAQTKAALELYYQDNKAYPPAATTTIPGTTGCDNTTSGPSTFTVCPSSSGNNWIPDLTNYIPTLPKDPKQAEIINQLASLIPKFNFGQIQQDVKSKIASLLPKFGGKETKPQERLASANQKPGKVLGTSTVTLDPIPADRGYIYKDCSSTVYPPNCASASVQPVAGYALRTLSGGYYAIYNSFAHWDTSSIPDGATITDAKLRLKVAAVYDYEKSGRSLTADWYSAWPLDSTDYSATAGTNALAGVALTSLTANVFQDWTLSNPGTNISKTGYTGLRFHISGGQPTWINQVTFTDYTATTLADAPKLVITYTVSDPNLYVNTLTLKTNAACTSAAPAAIPAGTAITICGNMGNNGGTATPTGFRNDAFRNQSTQPAIPASGDAGQNNQAVWAAGNSYTNISMGSFTASSTGCTSAGGGNYTCTAGVLMDSQGVITESNEADNWATITYTVATLPNLYLNPGSLVLRRNASPANCSNGTIVTDGTTVNSGEILEVCISGGNNGSVATGNYYISNFVNQPTQPAYGSPTWQTYGPFTQGVGGLPYSQLGSITADYSTCSTNCRAAVFIDDANTAGNSNLVTESNESDNFITSVLYNVTSPPDATLTAVPTGSIGPGSTTLTWSTTNSPTSCNGTSSPANPGWDGTKAVAGGNVNISNITVNTNFTLTCSKAGYADVVKNAAFTVTVPAPPAVNLSASPDSIIGSGTSILTWTTGNNPETCTGTSNPSDASWNGSKSTAGGSASVSVSQTTAFTITCTKTGYANVSSTATVTILTEISANVCTGKSGIYCYVATKNASGVLISFTLWAYLENLNDPEIYTKPGAKCTEIPPDAAKFNYCIRQD